MTTWTWLGSHGARGGLLAALLLGGIFPCSAQTDSGAAGSSGGNWQDAALLALEMELEGLRADGLDPEHYHLSAIREHRRGARPPQNRVDLDRLATDAFVRAIAELAGGRVRNAPDRALAPGPPPPSPPSLTGRITAYEVRRAFAEARPDHFVYRGLVEALADLRSAASRGGWPVVPDGPLLRPDSVDTRVPVLRARLSAEGYDVGEGSGSLYDPALESTVRAFQHRHSLNEDGVVGPATLRELNVPVQARIDQVRVNLERARWVVRGLPETFVAVNVAGQRVYLVRDGDVVFETRAIVGRTATRTPIFRATLAYVELNPTWTVPRGIVHEVLSRARADPGYLAREGIRMLDGGGRPVDPAGVELDRYTASTFPWVLQQIPGPRNALGRLKFVFPNPYDVYLHDTPARQLFGEEERTFSHGCIRVQDPVGLAALILAGDGWGRERLEDAIETGERRRLYLGGPMPVLVLYWTASADLHGELHFYRDIYGRDEGILRALESPASPSTRGSAS